MSRKRATPAAGASAISAPLSGPDAFVPMAEVVSRVMSDHPPAIEIAKRLMTDAPRCFLELAGRDIAKRAASELAALKTEADELAHRLAAFPESAEAKIGTAALWSGDISAGLYEITDPLFGEPTLKQQVERLRITLAQLGDAIPPEIHVATKRGRKTEAQIDQFLTTIAGLWKELTGLSPDHPLHHGTNKKFRGNFLDFAWEAIELARKLPKGPDLGLPHSLNALGERLSKSVPSS